MLRTLYERVLEVADDSKKTILPYRTEPIHVLTHRTYTDSNQTKFSTERERHSARSLTRQLYAADAYWIREN